ncbi:MAG: hypothetical protein H7222_11990 [Methylotenera sp.]|nr:hypothetical protein [Oligoflexia bacterium]
MKSLKALNLKQIERCLSLSLILMAVASTTVFAAPASPELQLDANGYVTCSTSSRGRNFEGSDYDYSAAQSNVIRQCQLDAITSNSECASNVSCFNSDSGGYGNSGSIGGYGTPVVRCDTSSNGRAFAAENIDSYLAQDSAIRQCQADPYTSNSQCSNNVSCSDSGNSGNMGGGGGYDPGGYTYPPAASILQRCTTSSSGDLFEASSIDVNVAQEQALGRCESQRYTSRYQCEANLRCGPDGYVSGGYGPSPQPVVVLDHPLPAPRPIVIIQPGRPGPRPQGGGYGGGGRGSPGGGRPLPQGGRPVGPQPRPVIR